MARSKLTREDLDLFRKNNIATSIQREYARIVGKKKLDLLRMILEELHAKTRVE